MVDLTKKLRAVAAAILIGALPVGTLSVTGAVAQVPPGAMPGMPTMGEPYPVTPEQVLAWVESYPALLILGQTLEDEFDVPAGEDPMAGFAALAAVTGAMAQLNAAVQDYGFADFEEWTNVMFAVVFAYSVLEAPAEQQAMLMGMFGVTEDNIAAVQVHQDAVRNLVDNL